MINSGHRGDVCPRTDGQCGAFLYKNDDSSIENYDSSIENDDFPLENHDICDRPSRRVKLMNVLL